MNIDCIFLKKFTEKNGLTVEEINKLELTPNVFFLSTHMFYVIWRNLSGEKKNIAAIKTLPTNSSTQFIISHNFLQIRD